MQGIQNTSLDRIIYVRCSPAGKLSQTVKYTYRPICIPASPLIFADAAFPNLCNGSVTAPQVSITTWSYGSEYCAGFSPASKA